MFDAISNENLSSQALNNLLVLSREEAGAEEILQFDSNLQRCREFLEENQRTIVVGVVRLLSSLTKNSFKRVSRNEKKSRSLTFETMKKLVFRRRSFTKTSVFRRFVVV
jgi:long-subunit acyl-CoA synthetase (AMP-forming)